MRYLWITRIDPQPADKGELIYSDRLIQTLGRTGAEVTVLCLARPGAAPRDGDSENGVRWSLVPEAQGARWQSALSTLPNIASRCATNGMRARLLELVAAEPWDVVVIDSLSAGWAAPAVRAAAARNPGRRPCLVYISHNHEETTRAAVARNYRGNPLKKAALLWDARKAAKLERMVVDSADLVTGITPADSALYAARRPDRKVVDLTPGYDGPRVSERRITSDMPRRVVMVGSFDWIAKQMNLRSFLAAAVPVFDREGAELFVVGDGGAFIDGMRREFPGVRFTGRVDSVYPYLDGSRMAVVAENFGGGFKLKALDYVFNRLPLAALDHTLDGLPLVRDDSVLAFPDFERLARGVISAIDDLPLLNRLQERAFAICAERFDWSERGRTLREAVGTI